MLPLQTMLLIREMLIHTLLLPRPTPMLLHMIYIMMQDLLIVQLDQLLDCELDVRDQGIAARAREVFAHDHAHHLQRFAVRGHGVGGHDPAAFAQLVGDGEFVEACKVFLVYGSGS